MGLQDEAPKVGKAHIYFQNTLIDFQHELRKYFTPSNAEKKVRVPLSTQASTHDYINEFTTLMLEIIDMSKEFLFYF